VQFFCRRLEAKQSCPKLISCLQTSGNWLLLIYSSFGCPLKNAELSKRPLFSNICFLFDNTLVPDLKHCLETKHDFRTIIPQKSFLYLTSPMGFSGQRLVCGGAGTTNECENEDEALDLKGRLFGATEPRATTCSHWELEIPV